MLFDPLVTRRGWLEFRLAYDRSQVWDSASPMGSVAKGTVESFIYSTLVGLFSEAVDVLPAREDWLSRALANGETMGLAVQYYRSNLLEALGLCKFLLGRAPEPAIWREAGRSFSTALEREAIIAKSRMPTEGLDILMAYAVLGQDYAAGIAHFERFHGAKSISLKKQLTPREFAYLWCQQQLEPHWEREALHEAGRRMLRARLQRTWLGYGQSNTLRCGSSSSTGATIRN